MSLERWWYVLPLRLRSLFRRNAVEQELDDELRYHVERQVDANIARGMPPDAARRAALRAMGGVEARKEECRDQRRVAVVDNVRRDIRHAVRLLRRSPIFAATAIGSLALGIGANTAIFQLIDRIRFEHLPIANPSELAEVRVDGVRDIGVADGFAAEITYPLWEQIRDHQQAFNGLFAWGRFQPMLGRGSDAQRVRALWASGDVFAVLGIAPARGRLLDGEDDRRGCGAGPVVISHAFWERYYGRRESAIGSRLTILDQAFTVVGITPPSFTGLEVGRTFDVVVPVCAAALWGTALDQRNYWWLTVMGRLKPAWTIEQASAHLRTLSPAMIDATLPSGYSAASLERYRRLRLGVLPAGRGVSRLRNDYGRWLWLLFAMTGLVLAITCANLALLLLARARVREKEITLRAALGASRGRIVGLLLSESLVVGVAGAVLSIPVALSSSGALVAFLSTSANPIDLDLSLNWRVALFAGSIALFTSTVFGLTPALRLMLVHPHDALREAARASTMVPRRSMLQRGLVVAQIAFSVVLCASALIFVRSFRNLVEVDTGFSQDGVTVARFLDQASARLPLEQRYELQQALADEIGSIPGVIAASASTHTPLSGASWWHEFRVPSLGGERTSSRWAYVGPRYFETMKIPVAGGRVFRSVDTARAQRVLVVNEAFVRTHLHGANPLGMALRTFAEPGYPETTYEIVGIVGDTMYSNLREGMTPIAFAPIAQHPALRPWANVLVRTADDATGVTTAIRQRVARLNPDIVVQVDLMKDQIRELMVGDRILAWLAGAMGALATTVAAVGLYGLMAYVAALRRKEIGIRLSLGSTRVRVIGSMLRESASLVGGGLTIGVPLAWFVTRSATALTFGEPPGAVMPTLAAGLIAVVAAASAAIPSWRASRLDPVATLRTD